MSNTAIKVENVSKKYCRTIKHTMLYGASDLGKSFFGFNQTSEKLRDGEFWAIENINVEFKQGDNFGIIGRNGSGKSTLLKMLNGIFMPDKGRIEINGRVGALIEVGAGFHPLLTGRENVYINGAIIGMSTKEIDSKFNEIIEFAEIGDFIDTPVKHYSSGMHVRLGFAIAVHSQPDILLIDEVLAVGDVGFQNKCFNIIGKLRNRGTTTLLVSHNMHIISSFSDKIIFLNNGTAKYFDSVPDGIKEYTELFLNKEDLGLEKICSGNDKISFYDIEIKKRILNPGDFFSLSMRYHSSLDYSEVEIDTVIMSSNELALYFQAVNKAYQKRIDLKKGNNSLKIKIEDIRINNAMVKIGIAIWSKDRTELLFWWRVPVEFKGVDYATGKNFLNVCYEVG